MTNKLSNEEIDALVVWNGDPNDPWFNRYVLARAIEAEVLTRVALSTPQTDIPPDHHILQADGRHPAPCARFCESNAYEIQARRLRSELVKAKAAQDTHDMARVAARYEFMRALACTMTATEYLIAEQGMVEFNVMQEDGRPSLSQFDAAIDAGIKAIDAAMAPEGSKT